jgi:dTDP-4-dehydrorhamnose reductase
MKWAVIGSNGMLGRELIELLTHKGEKVEAFNRGNLNLEESGRHLAARFEGLDVIINAAAYTNVDKAESEPEKAFFANATLPKLFSIAANQVDAKFIQISTDYVFKGDSETPYSTRDLPDPVSVYGKSKWEGEKLSLQYANAQVIRTAWLYGRFGNCFPKTVARKMLGGDKLRIVGDQVGSPTHARDLANFVYLAAKDESNTRILHGVSQGRASWFEFALAVAESLGRAENDVEKVSSGEYLNAATRPPYSLLIPSAVAGHQIANWREAWNAASDEILNE